VHDTPSIVHEAREPLRNAVTIAVPALDAFRGLSAGYERWYPERRISLAAIGSIRQSATGDFGATSAGAGAELRWYWRARGSRSSQPGGSMVGWFIGGRVDVAVGAMHDRVADDWLGTSLELGVTGNAGYRIAPWRGLEITPSIGLGRRRAWDLSGRLPSWERGTLSAGIGVGWLF
jgi:hypothetical protein